jgi:hypothetical protein
VGCHEPPGVAPVISKERTPLALKRRASKIEPPPWGTGGFDFVKVVQPLLNKKCVRCHDGKKSDDGSMNPFDLRGCEMLTAPRPAGDRDQGPQHCVSDSFLNLLKYVKYVQVSGNGGPATPLAAGATGSGASALMKILTETRQHRDLNLSRDEKRVFSAWIDCNAPFLGGWSNICIKPTAQMIEAGALSGGVKPVRMLTAQDCSRIALRRRALASGDSTLPAYIDCGLQVASEDGPVKIRQLRGKGWVYKEAARLKEISECHKNITFDAKSIVFELSGVDEKKKLRVHFSWWDYNNAGRKQSVWAANALNGKPVKLRESKLLPAWEVKQQPPEILSVDIPEPVLNDGRVYVIIKCDQAANAVLGEMWVTNR